MKNNFEECDGIYHIRSGVNHCVPCCFECQYCGRRIKTAYFDQHIESHNEDKELDTILKIIDSISEDEI